MEIENQTNVTQDEILNENACENLIETVGDETIISKTIEVTSTSIANKIVVELTTDKENLSEYQKITTAEYLLDENQLDNMAIIDSDELARVEDTKTAIPAREQLIEDCGDKKSDRLSEAKNNLSPQNNNSKSELNELCATTDLFNNSESLSSTNTDADQNFSEVKKVEANAHADVKMKIESGCCQEIVFHTPPKTSETDSLILTADDELETEMAMTDKPQDEISKVDNSTFKSLKISQPVSADVNKIDVNGETEKEYNLNNDANSTNLANITIKDVSDNMAYERSSNECSKVTSDNKSNAKKLYGENTKKTKIIWISNISSSARAADLKQFVSKVGKVITAKVVTDGKKCYGYIVMSTVEEANECFKTLNNEFFNGHNICVSFVKPSASETTDPKQIRKDVTKLVKKREEVKNSDTVKECDRKFAKHKSFSKTHNRSKSASNSCSGHIRRQSSVDPLTTKFKSCHDCHRRSKPKSRSRSRERHLREERNRLQRRYIEEQRRDREEIRRRIEKEERQKSIENKLQQEHKKLQLERVLFEKERRLEREKIEKERLEIMLQKAKLTEETAKIQSSSHVKKENYDDSSFARFKNFERDAPPPPKLSSDSKRRPSVFVTAYSGETVPSKLYKPTKRRISPYSSHFSGDINVPEKLYKHRKYVNKYEDRGCAMNNRQPFPERDIIRNQAEILSKPQMSSIISPSFQANKKLDDVNFKSYMKDFDLEHKPKQLEGRKYDCSDLKRDGKSDRSESHKIEVIDRKYYPDRSNDDGLRKHRKSEFEDRKGPPYSERKYDYNRDVKRFRNEYHFERDHNPRIQCPTNVNYSDTWKSGISNPASSSATGRFEENNFSASYPSSRIAPNFYQSLPESIDDYRYNHCQQVAGRKY